MLAAEETILSAQMEIHDLQTRIEELEKGDTVGGIAIRLTEVEGKTDDHEDQIASHENLITSLGGQVKDLEDQAIREDFFFINPTDIALTGGTFYDPYSFTLEPGETVHFAMNLST